MIGLSKFNDFAHHDVSRKEFMRYMAIALLSLLCVASLLQNLQGTVNTSVPASHQGSSYGSGVYAE